MLFPKAVDRISSFPSNPLAQKERYNPPLLFNPPRMLGLPHHADAVHVQYACLGHINPNILVGLMDANCVR